MAMTTILMLTAAILAVFMGYALLAPLALNLHRFIKRNWIYCPVHESYGSLKLNAIGASLGSAYGFGNVHVRKCSLLEKGHKCEEACLKDAEFGAGSCL